MKYPVTRQHDLKDCGAACLSMIIKFYGGYFELDKLNEMAYTTKLGTNAFQLIEAAKQVGFDAKGYKMKFEDFNSDVFYPLIAYTIINDSYRHYVVVYYVNKKNNKVIIGDPASGIKKMTFEEFKIIYQDVIITLYPVHKIPVIKKINSISYIIKKLLKSNYRICTQLIVMSVFITTMSIVSSFYFKLIIEKFDNSKTFLIILFMFFLIIELIKTVTEFLRNKLLLIINQKIDIVFTYDVFKKILLLPYNYYRNKTTGEIISRFNDLSKVKEMISKVVLTLFVDILLMMITLAVLIAVNKTLGIIAVIIALLYFIIIILFRKTYLRKLRETMQEESKISSVLVESISGFETIKGLNISKKIIDKFENKYFDLSNKIVDIQNFSNNEQLFKNLIYYLGILCITFTGSLLLKSGDISIGNLVLFSSLFMYFLSPFKNIVDLDTLFKESKIALKRVDEMLIDDKNLELIKVDKIKKIEFKNLKYFHNNQIKILNNINLTFTPGNNVFLIGQSGSGKSTLLKLIKKYYSSKGLYINDIDISNVDIDKKVTYLCQNETLFTDTIYNNIMLGNDIKEEELLDVLELTEVKPIIDNSILGLNTLIEENGFNISGGESQRIILARTLLNSGDVILIDEGLSEVDIDLERTIYKKIIKKYKDKIIIVVSHRLDNMDLFDNVIKMHNGEVEVSIKNE